MNKHSGKHDDSNDDDHSGGTKMYPKLVKGNVDMVLHNSKQAIYGDHNLLVYPSLQLFEQFYTRLCIDTVLNKNQIFLLATYYQDVSQVKKKLKTAGIDVPKYEGNGTLLILDSEIAYQNAMKTSINDIEKSSVSDYNIMMIGALLLRRAEKLGRNGVTILGDLGKFILNKELENLISYERSVPSRIDANIRPICCYHKDDFNKIRKDQRNRILASHANDFIMTN